MVRLQLLFKMTVIHIHSQGSQESYFKHENESNSFANRLQTTTCTVDYLNCWEICPSASVTSSWQVHINLRSIRLDLRLPGRPDSKTTKNSRHGGCCWATRVVYIAARDS
jgi:hypothetical protein